MNPSTGSPGFVRSVNVARVRELMLRGKPHPTGIFKEPVPGRVKLTGDRVEGDIQADLSCHGGSQKAVYAYTVEDYSWWEQQLGTTLEPGTFGENLTLEAVSATDALVGERWQVGSATLEVTQPREPCWKLGAKMQDPDFPRRFRRVGRAGAYLAIVEDGEVGTEDPVQVLHRPSHPVSMGLLAYLNHVDRKLAGLLLQLARQELSHQEWAEVLGPLDLPATFPVGTSASDPK